MRLPKEIKIGGMKLDVVQAGEIIGGSSTFVGPLRQYRIGTNGVGEREQVITLLGALINTAIEANKADEINEIISIAATTMWLFFEENRAVLWPYGDGEEIDELIAKIELYAAREE